jgi:hypothetical protein
MQLIFLPVADERVGVPALAALLSIENHLGLEKITDYALLISIVSQEFPCLYWVFSFTANENWIICAIWSPVANLRSGPFSAISKFSATVAEN